MVVSASLLKAIAADEVARQNRIARAWTAFGGPHPKHLPLRRTPDGHAIDDNIQVNFCKKLVLKSVSYLFGKDPLGVAFEIEAEEENQVAEDWLNRVWLKSQRGTRLRKLGVNGAVAGQAFLKIVPNPKASSLGGHREYHPKLRTIDPAIVTPYWQPDDYEEIYKYRIQYTTLRGGKPVAIRQEIELQDNGSWNIIDQESSGDAVQWATVNNYVWPWKWAPVIDCQNLPSANEYWGMADLEPDIIDLCYAIEGTVSNLRRIVRLHAHPKPYVKGMGEEEARKLNLSSDKLAALPEADMELGQLEMQSRLELATDFTRMLKTFLDEITRVPSVDPETRAKVGALAGVAIRLLYEPLIELTEDKRLTYGELVVETNRRLLDMGGFGDDNETPLHWPELVPSDPKAEAEVALLDLELGVSKDTLMRRRGFDPDEEKEKAEADDEALGETLLTGFERGEGGPTP